MKYTSIRELINKSEKENLRISELVKRDQAKELNLSIDEIYKRMKTAYEVMSKSIETGFKENAN